MSFAEELKTSILKKAFSGSLTKQISSENINEPVTVLSPDVIDYSIPDNWKLTNVASVVSKDIGGGTPSKSISEYWNGDIPWMSVKDFSAAENGLVVSTIDYITREGLKNSSTNLIDIDAIILCMRMGLGKIATLKQPTAINQDLRAIWLKNFIDRRYFILYYSTLKISGSGTTVKGIKRKELLNYPFPLPPLEEQQRIVDRVDELMAKVDELEKIEKELDALEKGFAEDLYYSTIKSLLNIGTIQDEAENVSTINDVANLISGVDLPKTTFRIDNIGVPYLTGASSFDKQGGLIIDRWVDKPTRLAQMGDLLITCKGTIGEMAFLPIEKAHIARQIMALRCKDNFDPQLLKYWMLNYVGDLKRDARSIIPGIDRKTVLNKKILVPSKDEQSRIVNQLDSIMPRIKELHSLTKH